MIYCNCLFIDILIGVGRCLRAEGREGREGREEGVEKLPGSLGAGALCEPNDAISIF